MKALPILAAALIMHATCVCQGLSLDLFAGLTNYQGDLRQRIFTFQGSRPAYGVGASYSMNGHFAVRLAVRTGHLGADDRLNKDSAIYFRNLSFQTRLTDIETVLVYRLFDEETSRFNAYAYGGFAGFAFNPFTYDQFGVKRYLQPLGTEGQGIPGYPQARLYSLTQFAIPFGMGLEYRIGDALSIAWEFSTRKTFTDYIDDLSTDYADEFDLLFARGPVAADLSYRGDEMILINPNVPFTMPKGAKRGNPGAMDLYYFTGVNLKYRFNPKGGGNGKGFGGSRSNRGTSCPKW
jgi:hypothetical protein